MTRIIGVFVICFIQCSLNILSAQDLRAVNISKLPDIDWAKADYNNVTRIAGLLDNFDILILAESDHGHGSSMDAQCMILRALIDSGKISTLYVESSWINCDRIMSVLRQKGEAGILESIKYMRTYELKYWVANGFWHYLAKKIIDGRLALSGFDIDGISPIIVHDLFNEVVEFPEVKKYSAIHEKEFGDAKWYFDHFEGWNLSSVFYRESFTKVQSLINVITKVYEVRGDLHRVSQWKLVLDFFYWLYRRSLVLANNTYSNQINSDKQLSAFHAVRDSLMAQVFLQNYNKNTRKVACSMSSYHAIRNTSVIDGLDKCCKDDSIHTMGEIIGRTLGGRMYSVCFISYSGQYGVIDYVDKRTKKIKKPLLNSIENKLRKFGYPFCFVNLRDQNISDSVFFMNAIFDRYLRSKWSENFSGVFFINKMEPLVIQK